MRTASDPIGFISRPPGLVVRRSWTGRAKPGKQLLVRPSNQPCDRICHSPGRGSGPHPGGPMTVFQHWPELLALGAALALGFALGLAAARAGAGRSREAFKALGADALRDNTDTFLALAGERFQRFGESSATDWDTRRKAVDDTVARLR